MSHCLRASTRPNSPREHGPGVSFCAGTVFVGMEGNKRKTQAILKHLRVPYFEAVPVPKTHPIQRPHDQVVSDSGQKETLGTDIPRVIPANTQISFPRQPEKGTLN